MNKIVAHVIGKIETTVYTQSMDSDTGLRVEDLAREVGMSRFQLQRLFKRETGLDLGEFIQQSKLQVASNFVTLTHAPLLDVALNVGYNGQQSFTRAFSKEKGVSPMKMRKAAHARYAPFEQAAPEPTIGIRSERSVEPRRLWMRRYVGAYNQVLMHWADFSDRLHVSNLKAIGPFYGVIFDDPDNTPADQIRYGCAIEAPLPPDALPDGWIELAAEPSRFVVFSLRCTYMEGHARLRPRVLSWFQQSKEAFGTAGAFEIYQTLPTGGDEQARDMELHVSLAN
ncbi:helix-turn-helix domain-containing protein [Trinickia sp. NRRL B-1857]|uniref:helix-turn-helix domain-containing protein n=1 Tax=Trinickia sp. NRRL B-1857 TaxID=3162879 RepID=UPI003D2A6DC9